MFVLVMATAFQQACTFGTTLPQQSTVLSTECKNSEEVRITDEVAELNGDLRWTASCDGKVFDCIDSPDSGTNCYQR